MNSSEFKKALCEFLQNYKEEKSTSGAAKSEEGNSGSKFTERFGKELFSFLKDKKLPVDFFNKNAKEKITINHNGIFLSKGNKNKTIIDPSVITLIGQPNGSQKNPDYYICFQNEVLEIECKSSDKGTPTWNSGRISPKCIYVLWKKSTGDFTYFLGKDRISEEYNSNLENYLSKLDKLKKEIPEYQLLKDQDNFDVYNRPMYLDKEKYFSPSKRQREEGVIHFLSN